MCLLMLVCLSKYGIKTEVCVDACCHEVLADAKGLTDMLFDLRNVTGLIQRCRVWPKSCDVIVLVTRKFTYVLSGI